MWTQAEQTVADSFSSLSMGAHDGAAAACAAGSGGDNGLPQLEGAVGVCGASEATPTPGGSGGSEAEDVGGSGSMGDGMAGLGAMGCVPGMGNMPGMMGCGMEGGMACGASSIDGGMGMVGPPMEGGIDGIGGMMSGAMGGWAGAGEYEPEDMSGQEGIAGSVPQSVPDGPCVSVAALSVRQPFASLILYGVKQLEARNRPALKQVVGPLAIHVSHKEEPYTSPLVSTAIAILRRRYPDEAISSLFQLPPSMAQAHGCIVGLVDVENTWHADLFNEIEQAQLSEQAVCPAPGTFLTQLRSPRWLKYPVRVTGSNRLWQVELPLDSLPDGTELDQSGAIMCEAMRERPAYTQQHAGAPLMEGDEMGLGLLGGDMVRQLQSGDGQGEADKKRKKLQKALRQIEELKAKKAQGGALEKTQEGKIAREAELITELAALDEAEGLEQS
mmetsp:Transcript_23344/g.50366  ORF Transcript_23344/g.50366 Transcript_23344/m.50366 type:complete len:443 (-) Transcript_23344:377-1705(-)